MFDKHLLAPAGSTGNATHNAVKLGPYEALVFHFVVEATGATPTVTYKFQGSVDGSNWFDIAYVTDANDTVAVSTRVRTTVGSDVAFLSNPVARRYQYVRLVTSSNTNVTYRGEVYQVVST